jgi:hypothetical protein
MGGVSKSLTRSGVLDKPWTIGELRRNGVIRQWPQSIVRVSEEGMKWLERELDPLP